VTGQKLPEATGLPHHVAVRLDAEMLARVDALAPSYSQPWRRATRSDLLRVVILAGLDAEETRVRREKGGPR
jgi:hypothetical protein